MASEDSVCTIMIEGVPVEHVEQVGSFTHLGSLVFTQDGQCTKDIKAKIGKPKGLMSGLKTLWQSHFAISTKVRLLRSLVWPVVSYGCESWTLKKSDEKRINSFEMKAFRQLLRVSWTDKRSNDWVLQKAKTKPHLLQAIKRSFLSMDMYYGRKEGNCTRSKTQVRTKDQLA